MVSAYVVFGLGIFVSLLGMLLMAVVIRAQIKAFPPDLLRSTLKDVARNLKHPTYVMYVFFRSKYSIKLLLLCLTTVAFFSNVVPLWFDIFRLTNITQPSNIAYSYIVNNYMTRAVFNLLLYLIYIVSKD